MYKIVFDFRNAETGWAWKQDYLDNNGKGFTKVDALMIAQDFNSRDDVKNAEVVEIQED